MCAEIENNTEIDSKYVYAIKYGSICRHNNLTSNQVTTTTEMNRHVKSDQ